jgi:inosine-uridine nucleoside N-ribohydrolase
MPNVNDVTKSWGRIWCGSEGFLGLAFALCFISVSSKWATCDAQRSSSPVQPAPREKIIIDTDIGNDIDDAFAIALALRSPELTVLGFSTASGDTAARARIIDRILGETGHSDIPVTVGPKTISPNVSLAPGLIGLQKRYGENSYYAKKLHAAAVEFILDQVRRSPGQVTLITIGPLSNVGALIERDVGTFRKLKRVVMMGGWVGPILDEAGQTVEPAPEYNIRIDVRSAQSLFASGVPIYVMPIDSTAHLTLDEVKRRSIFSEGTALTDALGVLYLLWGETTPVLFDAMAVAYVVDPQLCPVVPMHLVVDERGATLNGAGTPNAQVCLHSDANTFLEFYVRRIADVHG